MKVRKVVLDGIMTYSELRNGLLAGDFKNFEPGVKVYLDVSMRRFDTVFPACGSANSAIELTCDELEKIAGNCQGWIDVCKNWGQTE